MVRRVALTLLALLVVIAVLGGIKGLQFSALAKQGKSFVPPPEAVTAAPVKVDHWQPAVTSVGTVAAVQGVTVSAESSGVVRKIAFDSGAVARRGDLLIEIDQSSERAELSAASARAELAAANLDRTHHLLAVGANAAAALDTAVAEEKQARAQVATVRAALAKKTVRAPFSGRLGIRQVNLGEFVADGAPIVSLQSFDPIHVDFSLPQHWVERLAPGQRVEVSAEGFSGKTPSGTLTTINPDVDPETRNVALQATLTNPEGRLRPGMFVDARVVFAEKKRVLTVPATAVVYAPYGDSVSVVEKARAKGKGQPGYTVRQQFVRLGETRGDIASIASGLSPGQRVVTSGAFKLRPGMPVDVRSELAPDAELSPKPTDS
jgi:membrane fusion protein (multidrug efflux system)